MDQNALLAAGFCIESNVLSKAECTALVQQIEQGQGISKGSRNQLEFDGCAKLAKLLKQHPKLTPHLDDGLVAVQCTYFEKSLDNNWLVSIHQDLSIPVTQKVDAAGYSGWSEKQGVCFVQPPLEVLQNLIAVRLHLDPCSADDGALRVIPGSHRLGRLSAQEAVALRTSQSEITCEVDAGGVMLMKPLLLHASSKSTGNSQRRVLHFLFGPARLPGGVEWQYQIN